MYGVYQIFEKISSIFRAVSCHENRLAFSRAFLVNFRLTVSSVSICQTLFAMSAGLEGLKYRAASPHISGMGPGFDDAMGAPHAIASIRMLGQFSAMEANIKTDAAE